jgi:hypothetical protein
MPRARSQKPNLMQFTKDSFYMTLMERLESLYPQQTITLNGTTRPAIVVAENELVIPVEPLPDAFYIEWGAIQPVEQQIGSRPLMAIDCIISYHTFGTVQSGVDRGRTLALLDTELLTICQPPWTPKLDYTQTPASDLGTTISWTQPVFGKVSGSEAPYDQGLPRRNEGVRLERSATLKVMFFSEVNCS